MEHVPKTLLDLLSNSVVLYHLAPYLPVPSLLALSGASKCLQAIVQQNAAETFRYLDLSNVKSASLPYTPIDSGGLTWRSQRMDEALTEAEFYSGPLRGLFGKLSQRHLLKNVQTLILDGLSVPADLIHDIIMEDRFNVRVLSIREVRNIDERKLMQVLRYAARPTRPVNTPRLKALYFFQPKVTDIQEREFARARHGSIQTTSGVTTSQGAQIGATWNQKSQEALSNTLAPLEDRWYLPSGRILKKPMAEWGDTLHACQGIITFDAVLCRGPRHDVDTCPEPKKTWLLTPTVATIALGSEGCSACGSSPEGAATFGQSPNWYLPLLSPPPLHSATVRAAQAPFTVPRPHPWTRNDENDKLDSSLDYKVAGHSGSSVVPKQSLLARCELCLAGRWCESCNRWWDEDCYDGSVGQPRSSKAAEQAEEAWGRSSDNIKMGTSRECLGCGPTCAECRTLYDRRCVRCGSEFCIVCNEGSTSTACDWCSRSGRLRKELY